MDNGIINNNVNDVSVPVDTLLSINTNIEYTLDLKLFPDLKSNDNETTLLIGIGKLIFFSSEILLECFLLYIYCIIFQMTLIFMTYPCGI